MHDVYDDRTHANSTVFYLDVSIQDNGHFSEHHVDSIMVIKHIGWTVHEMH